MSGYFILQGSDVVAARSLAEWSAWWFSAHPPAARTQVRGMVIETVFTGVDHRQQADGEPLVFETRLGGQAVKQYASWRSAMAGHEIEVGKLNSPVWRRP
jgi:hypothetical protein